MTDLMGLATRDGIRAVVFDSVTASTLLPQDCLNLSRARKIVVVCVLQVVKTGEAAGSNQWPHLADVVLELDKLTATCVKSRFQPTPFDFPVLGGNLLCK